MESAPLVDCAGRRRSPATLLGYHRGRPPRNKGLRYPPDPPTVEEIIAVMRAAGDGPDGVRLRGVIVVLWRAGLQVRATGRRVPITVNPLCPIQTATGGLSRSIPSVCAVPAKAADAKGQGRARERTGRGG